MRNCSVPITVTHVVEMSAPAEVLGATIQLIAVLMGDLVAYRALSVEGLTDHDVDVRLAATGGDRQISRVGQKRRKNRPERSGDGTVSSYEVPRIAWPGRAPVRLKARSSARAALASEIAPVRVHGDAAVAETLPPELSCRTLCGSGYDELAEPLPGQIDELHAGTCSSAVRALAIRVQSSSHTSWFCSQIVSMTFSVLACRRDAIKPSLRT